MIITHQTTNDGFVTMCWRYLENPSIVDDDTDFQMVNPYWETVSVIAPSDDKEIIAPLKIENLTNEYYQ